MRGLYLRPPKCPLLPPPLLFAELLRLLPPRLPLADDLLGALPRLTEGLDVLRLGVKVLLGFLCVLEPVKRLLLPDEVVPLLLLLLLTVVRVLLSRLLR